MTSLPVHSLMQPGAGSATARSTGMTVKAAKGPPTASAVVQIGPPLERPTLMTISVITNANQAPADHHPALKRRASITSVIREHPRKQNRKSVRGGSTPSRAIANLPSCLSLACGSGEPAGDSPEQQPDFGSERNVSGHAHDDPNCQADYRAHDGKPRPASFSH